MKYFITPNHSIAMNTKAGCSSIANAIIKTFYPEIDARIHGIHYPPGITPLTIQRQPWCPSTTTPTKKPILLVRDPVERFISACAQVETTIDEALALFEQENKSISRVGKRVLDASNIHFSKQSEYITMDGVTCFLMPDHLEAFAEEVGLPYPLPVANVTEEKETPTAEQILRIKSIYADDINLFESITHPGILIRLPPQPIASEIKHLKKQQLAACRYETETGGLVLPNGMFILTDVKTRGALTSGAVLAMSNPNYIFKNYKMTDGSFMDLDSQTLLTIYEAVITFVSECFAKEKRLCDLVDVAITEQELDSIQW